MARHRRRRVTQQYGQITRPTSREREAARGEGGGEREARAVQCGDVQMQNGEMRNDDEAACREEEEKRVAKLYDLGNFGPLASAQFIK